MRVSGLENDRNLWFREASAVARNDARSSRTNYCVALATSPTMMMDQGRVRYRSTRTTYYKIKRFTHIQYIQGLCETAVLCRYYI